VGPTPGRAHEDPDRRRLPSWVPVRLATAVLAAGLCCAAATSPVDASATAVAQSGTRDAAAGPSSAAEPAVEPQVCSTCAPPLSYYGGPVMEADGTAGLTVTPVFWQPLGGRYVFPAKYESIIDSYIANVAAASGSTDNVYSVATEYYEVTAGVKTYIRYHMHAGGPIVDTDPFPPQDCSPAPGFTGCITDAQLRAELQLITSNLDLTTDLNHFYPVFLPPGIETVDVDGSNSYDGYCGYHRAFGPTGDKTVYADLPYEGTNCNAGQAPNGDLAADGAVNTLSHELNEAITDPLEFQHAWTDASGNELADMCEHVYGPPLGSTSHSDPDASEYNQVINGAPYYTQEMFSDLAYAKYGTGKGCAPSEAVVNNPDADGLGAQSTTVASAVAGAFPATLPADATATSTVGVTVLSSSGKGVEGDHVYFTTGLNSGTGVCGRLSHTEATTDANGETSVTYQASGWNVSCWVLAVEADGGQAAESLVYQGTTRKHVPAIETSFPTLLKAGAAPTMFTLRVGNPGSSPLSYARIALAFTAGAQGAPNVDAKQVHLSYSTTGPKGRFTAVGLRGSTGGGVIDAYLGPRQGTTMPAASSEAFTFRVALASNVVVSQSGPLVTFKAYLDRVNAASGSTSTMASSSSTNVNVPAVAPTNMMWYVLIGAAVVVVVVLAVVLAVLWRRRRKKRAETAATATT
jgi:hypothetical protein